MELEGNELETSLLESGDDLADEASLDAVRPGVQVYHKIVDIVKDTGEGEIAVRDR